MSSLEAFEPSAVAALQELRRRFPEAPFLTLGQTVLWDEPVKAAFCRILEAVSPDATMVAAVHDTDYFAKLGNIAGLDTEPRDLQPETEASEDEAAQPLDHVEKFVMLPHNDGSTRGLWSAAGELSSFFGSETVPTRHALTQNGVAFDRVARAYPGGAKALLDEQTEAWGWRALVHTEPHPLIAAEVKLADIAPALRRQLEWGFSESLQIPQLADGALQEKRDEIAAQIQSWIDEYIEFNEEGSLSDLYRALTPRLWSLVRGGGSCNLQTGASTELFRFNRATAGRARFKFVDLFLNPATRDIARRSYDDAVRGSGIYQLSQFGDGALPFDVVIRGRGRGTLRHHDGSLYIETQEQIKLCCNCDCSSVAELAGILEAQFGDNVVLVGKAVALISMLAAEFIFVFHETASSYTARTQAMNEAMRAGGLDLPLYPMLRLKYAAWDALEDVSASLVLPPHLASAFGREEIGASEFSATWRDASEGQDKARAALKACQSPRELMQHLAGTPGHFGRPPVKWTEKIGEYDGARDIMATARETTAVLAAQSEALHQEVKSCNEQAAQVERRKGEDWRANVQPLRVRLSDIREAANKRLCVAIKLTKEERAARAALETEEKNEITALRAQIQERIAARASFDSEIEAHRAQAKKARARAKELTLQRVATERSETVHAARETISRIEYEAELERLLRTRDALMAAGSLRYTNYRPTAWWFPLVSPDGVWFNGLVRTAEARIEEL